jgi:hypothetical protein
MPNSYPAQTNQSRFNFIPRAGFISAGDPSQYDVVDGGGSLNSAGFVGSCSGQVIGRVLFDPIMKRWGFKLDELRFANLSITGADATQISNFIATLAVVSVDPLV